MLQERRSFRAPAASGYEVEVTANIVGKRTQPQGRIELPPQIKSYCGAACGARSGCVDLTFQIGELSDVDISTFTDIAEGSMRESFVDLSSVATSTNISGGGDAVLENTAGVYDHWNCVYPECVAGTFRQLGGYTSGC